MAALNNIQIIGRLTATPESKDARGTNITNFTVAVDRFSSDGEKKADFFRCTAFGKQAEFVKSYLDKGALVYAQGRIEMNTVGEGNDRKTYTEVKVGVIQALSSNENKTAGYAKGDKSSPGTERFGHGTKEVYADDEEEDPFGP